MTDPLNRFSDRATDYDKWRPGYPAEVAVIIARNCCLEPGAHVADLGAGTGIFSRVLLDAGFNVSLVEPNDDMMAMARSAIGERQGAHYVAGTAEGTTLSDFSVDAAVAAQAFHWFDVPRVRDELLRITRAPHPFAAIWNVRHVDTTNFLIAYHDFLIEWGTDYEAIFARQQNAHESVRALFGTADVETAVVPYRQSFDYAGLEGRLLSCSYVPRKDQATFLPMLDALRVLYEEYAVDNSVHFDYDCRVFTGFLGSNESKR